jgi:hypothetical protein
MFETESEGVARLTAYLQQTKRQTEHSIDVMNQHIEEMQDDLETQKLVSSQLEQERDYFRSLSEQLKLENTKKWRLQERDDWKALLESVQEDRMRLQEECTKMEQQLSMAKDLLSPENLEVLEQNVQNAGLGHTPERREGSSISQTPPRTQQRIRQRRDVHFQGQSSEEVLREESSRPPPLSRHRSVIAVPLSRPASPGYMFPLNLLFRKTSTSSQVFYV